MPRFEYERMKGADLRDTLSQLGMPVYAFARIFGVRAQTVKRWLRDEQDIPPWVYVALSVLHNADGALGAARQAAAEHIRRDNNRPTLGEFPFRARPDDITEVAGNDDD